MILHLDLSFVGVCECISFSSNTLTAKFRDYIAVSVASNRITEDKKEFDIRVLLNSEIEDQQCGM